MNNKFFCAIRTLIKETQTEEYENDIEDVLCVFKGLEPENRGRVVADAFALTSKAHIFAESLYTYESPVTMGLQFFEAFAKTLDDGDIDYDSIDYKGISHQIKSIYKCMLTIEYQNKSYETIKDLILKIESTIRTIHETSITAVIEYDPEAYMKKWESFYEEFSIAPLAGYRELELEWLNFVHSILKEFLYENWFEDLINNTAYLSQSIFAEPVYAGLKAIGVEVSEKEILDNWRCYHKTIKYLVPKQKAKAFSKACRETLKPIDELGHITCYNI